METGAGERTHGERALAAAPAWPLAALSVLTLAAHVLSSGRYGYFRDELYYIACGEHPAWGYVDLPPMVAAVAALSRWIFGDSLAGLRLASGLAHAGLVLATGTLAGALGGRGSSRILAGVAAAVAPVYLASAATLNMNPIEQALWAAVTLLVLAIVRGNRRLWPLAGALIGLGLLNKHSFAFFAAALVLGLLATPERRVLRGWGPWVAAAIAAGIALPHLAWQVLHGFPTLEFLRNAAAEKNYAGSPLEFLSAQVLLLHPLSLPLWIGGVGALLRSEAMRSARSLGWSFLFALAGMLALRGKHYYLAPAFPALLAAGAVALERLGRARNLNWLPGAYASLLAVAGGALAPLTLPLLAPDALVRYTSVLGIGEPPSERHRPAKLPQTFADMFGWEELAASVARVYSGLSSEERARCAIFAGNYGEAGAIDFFGGRHGLPKSCSGHNSYWTWGPTDPSADIVIAVGVRAEDLGRFFERVEEAGRFRHEYNMPYESDLPILLARRPRVSWRDFWPRVKRYI